jgi:hypothetical protein
VILKFPEHLFLEKKVFFILKKLRKLAIHLLSAPYTVKAMENVPIMINQLPDSAARWQHEYQIYFATFIWSKIPELLIT